MSISKESINIVVSEMLEKKGTKEPVKNYRSCLTNPNNIRGAKTSQLIDAMLELGSIGFNKLTPDQEICRTLIKEQLKTRALSEDGW